MDPVSQNESIQREGNPELSDKVLAEVVNYLDHRVDLLKAEEVAKESVRLSAKVNQCFERTKSPGLEKSSGKGPEPQERQYKAAAASTFPIEFSAVHGASILPYAIEDMHERDVQQMIKKDFPHLDECSCVLVSSNLRSMLEDQVLEKLDHPKDSPLTVVSCGSGKCLQELVYVAKLYKQGYTNIRLSLIDDFEGTPAAADDLKRFFEEYFPRLKLDVVLHQTPSKYVEKAKEDPAFKPDLLLLIDLAGEQCTDEKGTALYGTETYFNSLRDSGVIKEGALIGYTGKVSFGGTPVGIAQSLVYQGTKELPDAVRSKPLRAV